MKLTKFRIYNYKSIIDSGYCNLASDITILIGKNESGKTATLEALRDFDQSILKIPESAIPLDQTGKFPRVEMCFEMSPSDIEIIQSKFISGLSDEVTAHILKEGLSIIKDHSGRYSVNDQFLAPLFKEKDDGNNNNQEPLSKIKSAKERLASIINEPGLPELNMESNAQELQRNAKELMVVVKSFLPSFNDENKKNEVIDSIRLIMQETNKLTGYGLTKEERFLSCITEIMPRFIYFSEFIGPFPFEVPVSRIKETEPLLDFAKITGLNLDEVINTADIQKRINTLNRHSAVICGDFGDYWQQNQIELIIKTEGDKIIFGVKEKAKTDFFKVEQRSKGFQWFLSFYLRISARASENSILLIDEPGINLHAKAQNEILKVLEKKFAAKAQVVLSTHSPYLIDPLRLDRIRVVVKDPQNGSALNNHIQSDLDSDTLMPVKTALKKDPTATSSDTLKTSPLETLTTLAPSPSLETYNILFVELADYYFLNALKKFIKIPAQKKINLLPCPEHGQDLDQLISLIKGFDFDFRLVFSRRIDDEDKRKYLMEKLGLAGKEIVDLPLYSGMAVEDFFSHDDFYTHVVQAKTNLDKTASHSLYFESNKIDCVVTAKLFYEKVMANSINLSKETVDNFQKVFDRMMTGKKATGPMSQPQESNRQPEQPQQNRWMETSND